jgi:hypothetical protein
VIPPIGDKSVVSGALIVASLALIKIREYIEVYPREITLRLVEEQLVEQLSKPNFFRFLREDKSHQHTAILYKTDIYDTLEENTIKD